MLAPLAFRQESFVVLLSITPLLDGVLQLDIIAPFHTSGPLLLQFHLAIEQWGFKEHNNTHQSTVKLPIAFKNGGYVGAANDSGTVTIGIKPTDKQTIELRDNNGGGKTGIYWFVVGQ